MSKIFWNRQLQTWEFYTTPNAYSVALLDNLKGTTSNVSRQEKEWFCYGSLLMSVWQLTYLKNLFLDPRWMEFERDCQSNSITDLWTISQRHLVTWPPAALPCRHYALWWLWNLSLPLWKHTIIWLIHTLPKSSSVNLPWWKIKPWGKGSLESPLRCWFLLVQFISEKET